jgi:hypothetical protein
VERFGWWVLLVGVPGDVEVVELELAEVPEDVMASAQQHQIAERRRATV